VRALRIYEGTTEIQRLTIAGELLNRTVALQFANRARASATPRPFLDALWAGVDALEYRNKMGGQVRSALLQRAQKSRVPVNRHAGSL
jgi:hypothetical protein